MAIIDRRLVATGEPSHALFVHPKGGQEGNEPRERERPRSELRERGELPRIARDHIPALQVIFGMGEDDWTYCPIPDHHGCAAHLDEGGPIAFEDGKLRSDIVLWCDCLGATLYDGTTACHWYALSDVYLAVKTSRKLDLFFRSRYRTTYALLLLAELGLIEAAPRSETRAVDLSERARVVADLFTRLYAAQQGDRVYADGHHEPGFGAPGAMSVRLVQEWCECSRGAAWETISELLAAGVIERAGKLDRTNLYRPGGAL